MPVYKPYGPFVLPKSSGQLNAQQKNEIWAAVEKLHPGLAGAIGCYIFGIRAGRGVLPWYVGMTKRKDFKFETWQPRTLLALNSVLNGRKGAPVLYLIAKHTPRTGTYARPGKLHTSIAQLEELLIGVCLLRNPKLLNRRATKFIRETVVPGYLNGGRENKTKQA